MGGADTARPRLNTNGARTRKDSHPGAFGMRVLFLCGGGREVERQPWLTADRYF
jgi:hypothetical protein